ncbi:GntR family transcriptional regulator [Streptomyces hirsutus]|uniref:GntR family transcriptional regulator n=1 Tax=Streptomyces hirsutus TaxID=35620 RepID=UPI0006E30324|nr:GntR family transcriptional regulator [Streptomyces hirsutus]
MTFTPIPAPLYQRIFAVLSQRIGQGGYAPGSRFATEDELVAEFGVSKATVRRAVGELVARGQLIRRQGSGTYVRGSGDDPAARGFVGSIGDLIRGTPQLKVLDVHVEEDVRFPASVRQALGTDAETGTVYRTRRLWGDQPFVYSVHYVGPTVAAVLGRAELAEEGLMSLLRRENVEMSEAEQTLSARLADVEVADRLNIGLGAAVLFAERVLRSPSGPLDCLHSWYRGDLYRWQARLAVEPAGR